jgi:hypothetical protein
MSIRQATQEGDAPSDAIVDAIAERISMPGETAETDESEELDQDEVDTSTDDEDSDDPEAEADLDDESDESEELDDDSLAAHLGLSEDDLEYDEDGKVVFNAVVGDEKHQVTMADLVKSYQLEQHVNGKSMELSAKQKTFDEESETSRAQINANLQSSGQLVQVISDQLVADFNQINWDLLAQQDPAEHAIQRQAYADRAQQIQRAREVVQMAQQESTAENQKVFQGKHEKHVTEQVELMMINNPTWRDEKVFDAVKTELHSFLKDSYGFNQEEVDAIYDSRLVSLIQDAHMLRTGKKVAAKKREKKVPKFRKPGRQRAANEGKVKASKAKRAALKKSGSQRDLVANLQDRM